MPGEQEDRRAPAEEQPPHGEGEDATPRTTEERVEEEHEEMRREAGRARDELKRALDDIQQGRSTPAHQEGEGG